MSAIQVMKMELKKIQRAQDECLHEDNTVKPYCLAKLDLLIKQARSFKESIEWLEA